MVVERLGPTIISLSRYRTHPRSCSFPPTSSVPFNFLIESICNEIFLGKIWTRGIYKKGMNPPSRSSRGYQLVRVDSDPDLNRLRHRSRDSTSHSDPSLSRSSSDINDSVINDLEDEDEMVSDEANRRLRAYWLGAVVCMGGFLFGYDSGM